MKVIVIGGGPGGYTAAISAAKKGADQVDLIEKGYLGGTCLNRGCIPTKAVLHSAHAYYRALKSYSDIGVDFEGISLDFDRVMRNKDALVEKQRNGIERLLEKNGVNIIRGEASFLDANSICVRTADGDLKLTADRFLIAAGSKPAGLPFADFDGIRVINSDHLLQMEQKPASLAIVGGGVIGCEFAQAFTRMGVRVSIVEMLPRLIANMDPDQSAIIEKTLKREKVDVFTEHNVTGVEAAMTGVKLRFRDTAGCDKEIDAEKLLVAVGRTPNSEALCLERAGVFVSPEGFVEADAGMRTNIPGIYAIGDITGKMLLAHVASHQGLIAAENMLGGEEQISYDAIPQCVYTEPEIASIGKTETDADSAPVIIGAFLASANSRAMIEGITDGFSKVVVDEDSRAVVGVHLAGPNVTEMISGMSGVIQYEVTLDDMHSWIFAHPSVSEMIRESILDACGMAIHK